MAEFPRLDDINLTGKTVLVRADLNVPMQGGKVTDDTRIVRIKPTIDYLLKKKAKIVLLSHFGRPEGKFVPGMSLAPLIDSLAAVYGVKQVRFGVDCVGPAAHEAVKKTKAGEMVLLENLRFHPEEEKGDKAFARDLASLGDVFVNDAFSCSHRAHASITGIAEHLPTVAGRLMEEELRELSAIFTQPKKPITAIVGGSKVSTKLDLLNNLARKMDSIIIGGAMANTFLYAQGFKVGASLHEPELKATALKILKTAEKYGCRVLLPSDVVVAKAFETRSPCVVVDVDAIPAGGIAIDVGPASIQLFSEEIARSKTVVWNGPMGAFEISPFDASSVMLARVVAKLTRQKKIRSIGGGGDTVSALTHSALSDFSYISTAGGAFLEWLEGKKLPGVVSLSRNIKNESNTKLVRKDMS
ncbi:MAG: phosphoglycerate kinase [Rickettsiales bacterium]|jgi:phosphoglycerate kinase|nr:phosphoglycerate kinase [Rickettsiales bacterium]